MHKKAGRLALSLIATAGLLFSALPVNALAGGEEDGRPDGAGWVEYEGEWYQTGLLFDDREASSAQNRVAAPTEAGDLPAQVDLSRSDAFPPILDQGSLGACTSFSTVGYQFTYEVARKFGWKAADKDFRFSPRYVYNYLNAEDNRGTAHFSNYEFLQQFGAVRESAFSSESKDYKTLYQNSRDQLHALQYRVSSYVKGCLTDEIDDAAGTDTIVTGPDSPALNGVKSLLAEGHPLCIGMYGFEIKAEPTDRIVDGQAEVAIVLNTLPGGLTGHAVTVVGYDDTIQCDMDQNGVIEEWERGAFKIANSWGTDFGNDGFIWMMYDTVNKVSNQAPAETADGRKTDLNEETRQSTFSFYEYYYIEVERFSPAMVGEITLPADSPANSVHTYCYVPLQYHFDYRLYHKSRPYTLYFDVTPDDPESLHDPSLQLSQKKWQFSLYSKAAPYTLALKYYDPDGYDASPPVARVQTDPSVAITVRLGFDFALADDGAPCRIDRENKRLYVRPGARYQDVRMGLMGGTLDFSKENHVFGPDSFIPTGAVLLHGCFAMPIDAYTCVQYGDLTGDGLIDQRDADRLAAHLQGVQPLTGVAYEAARFCDALQWQQTDQPVAQRDLDALTQYIQEHTGVEEGAYILQNHLSGWYLDGVDSGMDGGTPVQQGAENGQNNQIWLFQRTEDGYYRVCAAYKPSLRLTYNSTTNNAALSTAKNTDLQKWQVTAVDGRYRLIPKNCPDKVLAASGNSLEQNSRVTIAESEGATVCTWTLQPVCPKATLADGMYTFRNQPTGLYLDGEDFGEGNNTKAQTFGGNGGNNQKWLVRYEEDGYYSIMPVYKPSLCLSYHDDTGYVRLDWNTGAENQRWLILQGKNGDSYRLAPKCALDKVAGAQGPGWTSNLILTADNLTDAAGQRTKWVCEETIPAVVEGIFRFQNKNSGLYMDVYRENPQADIGLTQYENSLEGSQFWRVRQEEDGYCTISACLDDTRVMTICKASSADTYTVEMRRDEKLDTQKWLILKGKDGSCRFSPKLFPKQAAVIQYASADKGARMILYADNGSANGKWERDAGGGLYYDDVTLALLSASSSFIGIEMASSSTPPEPLPDLSGAEVVSQPAGASNSSWNVHWLMRYEADGSCVFIKKGYEAEGMEPYCLTYLPATGGLVLLPYTGLDTQKWRMDISDAGQYEVQLAPLSDLPRALGIVNGRLTLVERTAAEAFVAMRVHGSN